MSVSSAVTVAAGQDASAVGSPSAGQDRASPVAPPRRTTPPQTDDWANGPVKPTVKPEAQRWAQLSASKAGSLNPVVVNGAGFTLHRFDRGAANPSKSACNGDCAVTWLPVVVAPGGRSSSMASASRRSAPPNGTTAPFRSWSEAGPPTASHA
ncbi:hypothetical protein [Streptomyces netropsis]